MQQLSIIIALILGVACHGFCQCNPVWVANAGQQSLGIAAFLHSLHQRLRTIQ